MGGKTGFPDLSNSIALGFAEYVEPVEEHFDALIDPTVPTVGDLPLAENWTNRRIYVTATGQWFRWNDTTWVSMDAQHAEFLFNRSAIGDGVNTLFSTSVDAAKTNDTTFATIAGATGQTVTLVQAGLYAIDFYFQVAGASTGRFGGTITVPGSSPNAAIAQAASWSQENALSTSVSNFKAAANTPVLFSVEKHTGGATADISTRIRVTRLGN